ncbi:hypothetical protein L6164_025879 [Bauhinia variegata]|uniref:Uncharacterized protein n=1 Tax=Bauhinia variegata TaxID=167791 RepID=A0ACB9M215_BAUVA|nr:hypothetical protein L6164_025879 [Bauhinia variegata]
MFGRVKDRFQISKKELRVLASIREFSCWTGCEQNFRAQWDFINQSNLQPSSLQSDLMAVRVHLLCKKLKKLAEEKSVQEISPHLLKMGTEFERLLQALSIPDVELRRENDVALGRAISKILNLVQAVEDITDSYSHMGQSISPRIYYMMRQFLHKHGGTGNILGRMSSVIQPISGPSFPDMLKNFSELVCSLLEKLVWQIEIIIEIGDSADFNFIVQFNAELDGWENIEFDIGEVTSLAGSEADINEFC